MGRYAVHCLAAWRLCGGRRWPFIKRKNTAKVTVCQNISSQHQLKLCWPQDVEAAGRLGEAVSSMELCWAWGHATGLQCSGPLHPSSQQRGIILTTCNGKEWDTAKTSPTSVQIQGPWRDGGAVAACLGLSPFWVQPLCSCVPLLTFPGTIEVILYS